MSDDSGHIETQGDTIGALLDKIKESADNSAASEGERPFDERLTNALLGLGAAIATLNHRADLIDQRIDALERAFLALAKSLGVSPVWSNEISDDTASGGVKH